MARVLGRRGGSATIALLWLLLAYATVVMTLGEIEENQRIRFVSDPLVAIVVAASIARAARAVRTVDVALSPPGRVRRLSTPSPGALFAAGIAVGVIAAAWLLAIKLL